LIVLGGLAMLRGRPAKREPDPAILADPWAWGKGGCPSAIPR
jgi:hypothetical protein